MQMFINLTTSLREILVKHDNVNKNKNKAALMEIHLLLESTCFIVRNWSGPPINVNLIVNQVSKYTNFQRKNKVVIACH